MHPDRWAKRSVGVASCDGLADVAQWHRSGVVGFFRGAKIYAEDNEYRIYG